MDALKYYASSIWEIGRHLLSRISTISALIHEVSHSHKYGNQDSSIWIVTTLRAGRPWNQGSNTGRDKRISSLQRPDWLWSPSNLISNEYRGLFLLRQSGRGVTLTTNSLLMPRIRMHAAVLPLHNPSSWLSA
jgi:hypothetical protein